MLKSLFSGVSGLQSSQVAMDIESNNIANVNTVGYKYSRANFSDLLAQTQARATAPGQVGLGSTVTSATRIFSQGSIQNSDKTTDIAIQGDGFFIISGDNGNTYKYTRAGDFKFDAGGNFVDNNGFVAQGWLRDPVTGKVDSTAPITSLNITPGLTTPASPTSEVVLKANLNSGTLIESFSSAYAVVSGIPPSVTTPGTGDAVDSNGNAIASGNIGVMFNEAGEAFSLQQGQGIWASFTNASHPGTINVEGAIKELNIAFTLSDGSTQQVTTSGAIASNTPTENANRFISAINDKSSITGVSATLNISTGNPRIDLTNTNNSATASKNISFTSTTTGLTAGTVVTAYKYQYDPAAAVTASGSDKTFTTMSDLRYAMELQAKAQNDTGGVIDNNIEVIVNDQGKFVITNPGGGTDEYDMNLNITAYTATGITNNTNFTKNMESLNSVISAGSGVEAFSQGFNTATHSSSIDVFDSLGSKHTIRMEFRKTALETATGSTWAINISVPAPATIDTTAPFDEKTGTIHFNNDGSLETFNPPNLSFSANNGSAPEQQVRLSFGSADTFEGMTSFNSRSSTSGISQDGFTGGNLLGIKIDQSGTLVGSFSNGHSFGLAQIGMAKFANNEGLSAKGGNIYDETANSGDAIIGTAASGGRGFIQSSALEASNVDLSRALTQLIIIQRGFQANGKTVTTSDQLLQTLIGLKN